MPTRCVCVVGITIVAFTHALLLLAHAETNPIKLGQVISVTGELAMEGLYQRQGSELAIEKINASGGINGRKLTLIVEDDQTTNPGAVGAIQKLLEDKDIPMLLGSNRSTALQAMLPTINEAKIPVAIGGTNYGLTHTGSQWVFRFRPNDGFTGKVIAKFLVEELKQKKIGIVYANDAFGTGLRDFVVPALKELNAEVAFIQGVNNGEKDFTGVVQGLRASTATAFTTLFTFSTDLGVFSRQVKQLGISIPWVGSPTIASTNTMYLGGDALYGTYGVTDFHVDASPTSKTFAAAFRAKYSRDPDYFSAWCYDAVTVFAETMRNAPDLAPNTLRRLLLNIHNFPGAEGMYNFDLNGDGLDHYHVVKNQNGTLIMIKTLHGAR